MPAVLTGASSAWKESVDHESGSGEERPARRTWHGGRCCAQLSLQQLGEILNLEVILLMTKRNTFHRARRHNMSHSYATYALSAMYAMYAMYLHAAKQSLKPGGYGRWKFGFRAW